jgi:Tol biopolymer transport system component
LFLVAVLGCGGDDGSRLVPPTPVFPTHQECPSWSPQGEIAYRDNGIICVRENSGYYVDPNLVGIWVLNASTGERHRLIPFGDTPKWSRDGGRLAFSYGRSIHIVRRDGTERASITANDWNFFPCWSPDGGRIAWERSLGDSAGIWIANADGTSAHRVLAAGSGYPDWHPTADRLLFVVAEDSSGVLVERLTEFNLTDRSRRLVLRIEDGYAMRPSYSPDGSRIAVGYRPAGTDLSRVWVVNVDGTGFHPITQGPGTDPSWNSEGTRVVFSRVDWTVDRADEGVLWTVDLATGEETQLLDRWPESCE